MSVYTCNHMTLPPTVGTDNLQPYLADLLRTGLYAAPYTFPGTRNPYLSVILFTSFLTMNTTKQNRLGLDIFPTSISFENVINAYLEIKKKERSIKLMNVLI